MLRTIAWLPAHPDMGWASMNRCWHALDRQSKLIPQSDLRFVCPLQLPTVEQPAAPRWKQWFTRQISYPLMVKALPPVDAVHVLDHSFADLLRWVRPGTKKIVTVHDLIPLLDPAGMSKSQVQRFRERAMCLHQADLVLCVSEFTKQSVVEHLKVDELKLHVLPNGVDLPDAQVEDDAGTSVLRLLPSPRLLIVGSNLERKNLRLLPRTLKQLVNCHHLTPSVIRVGPALPIELRQSIEAIIGADRLVELGCVSDKSLAGAYRASDMLFFPSTLEGFGLPVLEAMAHGCPVVCSSASSLPEVAGDAALYFETYGARESAVQVVQTMARRDALSALSRQRAEQMTWTRHWDRLRTAYRSMWDRQSARFT